MDRNGYSREVSIQYSARTARIETMKINYLLEDRHILPDVGPGTHARAATQPGDHCGPHSTRHTTSSMNVGIAYK